VYKKRAKKEDVVLILTLLTKKYQTLFAFNKIKNYGLTDVKSYQ